MADQTTTVAAMPIGFATISGLVYAFIASPPLVWSHTCWSKMGRWMPRKVIHPGFSSESTYRFDLEGKSEIDMVCYALARSVTQGLRRIRPESVEAARVGEDVEAARAAEDMEGNRLLEQIAALHFLMWWKRVSAARGSDEIVQETAPASKSATRGSIEIAQEAAPSSYTIIVNIVDHQRKASPYQVTITEEKLSNRVAEVFENTGKPQELDFGQLFNTAVSDSNFPTRVAAQAIAKWDTLLIEAGYKGIEILFAISITLGSTGGAWLGLTLASIFPQRVAAGLYSSASGQALSRKEVEEGDGSSEHVFVSSGTMWIDERGGDSVEEGGASSEHVFVSPGTVWADGENGYCVSPCLPWAWFEDDRRNQLGYWVQYILLYVLTWLKQDARNAVFGDGYVHTVDGTRYVVLVVEPVILAVCLWSLKKKSWTWWRTVAALLYVAAWAMAITCMVWGQGKLDSIVHLDFLLIPRVVEPFAAIGSIAAVYAGAGDGRDLSLVAGSWGLLWAIGVCSAVW